MTKYIDYIWLDRAIPRDPRPKYPPDTETPIDKLEKSILWDIEEAKRMYDEAYAPLKAVA